LQVFQSDGVRALAVLLVAVAGAATVVTTRTQAEAESATVAVLYTIINMTERTADRQTCPLDLESARARIEAGYIGSSFQLEYSPLADGPDVLLHELSAAAPGDREVAGQACTWTIRVSYQGQSLTRQSRAAPMQTPASLGMMISDTAPLLTTSTR